MGSYAVYDSEGRIISTGYSSPETIEGQAYTPGSTAVACPADTSPHTHYWDGSGFSLLSPLTATLSKSQITADGVDEAVLSPLPDPANVRVDKGDWQAVTGGSLEFSANAVGVYEIEVEQVGYAPQVWEVEAI